MESVVRFSGLGGAGVFLLVGILSGSSIWPFIDPGSMFIVLGMSAGLVTAVHGYTGWKGAFHSLLGGAPTAKATALFMHLGLAFLAAGATGTVIGIVQMLQQMSDPTAVGPAMAVALLTMLYGLLGATLSFSGAIMIARRDESDAVEAVAGVSAAAMTLASLMASLTSVLILGMLVMMAAAI